MRPILIRVNRKTKEFSPNPKYPYRICFRFVHKLDYSDSEYIFKNIGNLDVGLGIEKDSQFAKYLRDLLGPGLYTINIWKKGRGGNFTFYYFDCSKSDRFRQIPIKKSKEKEELEKVSLNLKKLKGKLKVGNLTKEQIVGINNEIREIYDDADMETTKEIIKLDRETKFPKIKPFKNSLPLYREHEYEEYGSNESGGTRDLSFW